MGIGFNDFERIPEPNMRVRNTFIDLVDEPFDDDDEFEPVEMQGRWKRTTSEPAPSFARQMSGPTPKHAAGSDALPSLASPQHMWVSEGSSWSRQITSTSALGALAEEELAEFPEDPWRAPGEPQEPESEDSLPEDSQSHQFWSEGEGGQLWADQMAAGPLQVDGQAALNPFALNPGLMQFPPWYSSFVAPGFCAYPGFLPGAFAAAPAPASAFGAVEQLDDQGGVSTVMMRNLANKITQLSLIEEINNAGFAGCYDFLYLPLDPETKANKGYAFINFVDPSHTCRFKLAYEGRQLEQFCSTKRISVSPAALQGFDANHAHYSTCCRHGDSSTHPLFLRETSLMRAPRARRGRRRGAGSLIDFAAKAHIVTEQQQLHWAQVPLAGISTIAPMHDNTFGSVSASSSCDVRVKKDAEKPGDTRESLVASFCQNCGSKFLPDYRFCRDCGASLSVDDTPKN